MVIQYPYSLEVYEKPVSTYNDQTGDWTNLKGEWVFHSICRDEKGGSGSYISGSYILTVDGQETSYDYLVQLPKNTAEIKPGTKVRVKDGETIRLESTVIRFSSDQLHCRLWL